MKSIVHIVATLGIILGSLTPVLVAQDKVGMYPLNAFESKHLPIGTAVWVNLGDTDCAWGSDFPSTADKCFESGDYVKGRIIDVFSERSRYTELLNNGKTRTNVRYWYYLVEYQVRGYKETKGHYGTYVAKLDEAYVTYNLPAKWAEYSKYFVRLNW